MKRNNILRWQFLTSTISTTMVLLLLGTLILFVLTAREMRDYVRKDMTVTVVLADGTVPTDAHAIEERLAEKEYVHHVNYISSEQALREHIDAMGIDPVEFLGGNPFSISMELGLQPDYVCSDSISWIVDDLQEESAITDVIYQNELLKSLNRNLNTITIILFVITAVLSVVCISLINNTVHLCVYSRRFIINTMKLVGAGWGFIRRPFMLHSLYMGLAATAIADSILFSLIHWATGIDTELNQFMPGRNIAIMAVSVLAFALLITQTCTYISVTRFLRMRERDLYK
ncbi:MAG: permease-like cell division protein FtsX [Bacteroidaceae bacterium]|nr:permease-like cell division protein FtsX [Bacteroidaceae bacterium]